MKNEEWRLFLKPLVSEKNPTVIDLAQGRSRWEQVVTAG